MHSPSGGKAHVSASRILSSLRGKLLMATHSGVFTESWPKFEHGVKVYSKAETRGLEAIAQYTVGCPCKSPSILYSRMSLQIMHSISHDNLGFMSVYISSHFIIKYSDKKKKLTISSKLRSRPAAKSRTSPFHLCAPCLQFLWCSGRMDWYSGAGKAGEIGGDAETFDYCVACICSNSSGDYGFAN